MFCTHPGPSHAQLPHINIPHQSGAFVIINEPTYHRHPKSVVYIKVHFWWRTFYGFKYMDLPLQIVWNSLTDLKILCPACLSLPPTPLATTGLFTASIVVNGALSHRSASVSQSQCRVRVLSLSNFLYFSFHLNQESG